MFKRTTVLSNRLIAHTGSIRGSYSQCTRSRGTTRWINGFRVSVTLFGMAALSCPATAQTGLLNHSSAEFFSHEGNVAFLAAGVLLPLLRDGNKAHDHSIRSADTLLTSALLCEGLKRVFRKPRPDGSSDSYSFPSGHATAAFAIASMASRFHPKEGIFWYAGAFLIADSRVTLNRHRPEDVIAGAVLGIGTTAWEVSSSHGLILAPLVRRNDSGNLELGFRGTF